MKKLIVSYGFIAAGIVVGIPVFLSIITGFGPENFSIGEVVGYSSMIVAMALIFFAVKNFRDKVNGGAVTFGESMRIGLGISTIGGLAWAIYNFVFVTWIMPDFNEQYVAYLEGLEIGTPEFEAKFQAAMSGSDSFMYTPIGGSILMFFTVFLIGLIFSVISGLILRSSPKPLGT